MSSVEYMMLHMSSVEYVTVYGGKLEIVCSVDTFLNLHKLLNKINYPHLLSYVLNPIKT